MAERRREGTPCPIDEVALRMAVCQPCRFFRGASLVSPNRGWTVLCNWPIDGTFVDRRRIPQAFTEGWDK